MRRDHAEALAQVERDLARRGLSEKYRQDVVLLSRALLAHARRAVSRIGRADVAAFLAARRGEGIALATQAGDLSKLRAFFSVLVRDGLATTDPTARLFVPRRHPPPHRLMSEADVARLLSAATAPHAGKARRYALGCLARERGTRDPAELEACLTASGQRDRAALELLYGLGLRSAEVRAARVVDLDLALGSLLVRRAKRGQPEPLPLAPATVAALRVWLEARPLLARGEDGGHLLVRNDGRPYDRASGISKLVARVARRAQVFAHAHGLRRGVATHLVRAGAPITVVQQLLGHARLETTAIYVEVEREDLRRAVATLDRTGHRAPAGEAEACRGERGAASAS